MRAYYNEIDRYCCDWLQNLMDAGHITPGKIDDRSIENVSPDDVRGYDRCHFFAGIAGWELALKLAGWGRDSVWTGSVPCQPLSCAGQRKGHADERHLWPAFFNLIKASKPAMVFGEQVASRDGLEWFAGVRADLGTCVYACGAVDLPAASVGTPHIRQRLWWCATNSDRTGLQAWNVSGGLGKEAEASPWRELKRVHAEGDWAAWQAKSRFPVFMDGVPAYVAQTRAFGNAIVPQVAAEFIKASVM